MMQGDSFQTFFWFLKKVYVRQKQHAAWFDYISIALKLGYNKNKLHRILCNFDFLEKGLGIVSPPHFVYDFSIKMFLMLYYIN